MRFGTVLYAILVIITILCYAHAQEADEFDGLELPIETITLPEDTIQHEPQTDEHNFVLEAGSLAFAALYFINYLIGKSQNAAVANKWLAETEPHLIKEFSYTGSSAEPKVGLLNESKSLFRYYCTGRRFCSRMIIEIQMISRHDLISRLWNILARSPDYLTYNVSFNANDLDPIVFAICKKLQFNNVAKACSELITMAKRIEHKDLPDSLCMQSDNIEIPKIALTKAFIKQLETMEPFLESLVLSDVMKLPIVGMPNSETRVLRICFRMHNGSQTLDMLTAASFVTTFIDTVGSTFKLSRELKAAGLKKRAKLVPVNQDPVDNQRIRRMNELREKKRAEYENLSYEEKQKVDEQLEKKQARKRIPRKK